MAKNQNITIRLDCGLISRIDAVRSVTPCLELKRASVIKMLIREALAAREEGRSGEMAE